MKIDFIWGVWLKICCWIICIEKHQFLFHNLGVSIKLICMSYMSNMSYFQTSSERSWMKCYMTLTAVKKRDIGRFACCVNVANGVTLQTWTQWKIFGKRVKILLPSNSPETCKICKEEWAKIHADAACNKYLFHAIKWKLLKNHTSILRPPCSL